MKNFKYVVHVQVQTSPSQVPQKFVRDWSNWRSDLSAHDVIDIPVDGQLIGFYVKSRKVNPQPPLHLICDVAMVTEDTLRRLETDLNWDSER